MTDREPESGGRLRKAQSLARLTPNIVTLLAFSAGLTAIRYALEERWEAAVTAIAVAALLDASDGRLARLLGTSSRFGAELDSLADLVSFGVAPAVTLYLWTMSGAGPIGWALCLLFALCVALRLARFNTTVDDPDPPRWQSRFFSGVSSPAGAGFVMLPVMLSFQGGSFEALRHPAVAGPFLVCVGLLMVSRVPTYAFKGVRVPARGVLPFFVTVGVAVALLVGAPWFTLSAISLLYLMTIPFSYRTWRQLRAEHDTD